MKSIQTKFIILILGCVLLSSGIIGGVGIFSAQRSTDSNSAKVMNLMCSDKSKELNALLSRIEQSVKTLSVYAASQLKSVSLLKTDNKYVDDYVADLEDVAVNAASNTEGAVAVYVRFNPDFTAPTSGLFWSKTTLDGSFKQQIPTDFSSFNPNDTERVGWYYIPVKNGKPTWMSPYYNQNINLEMISFVIPLYVENETIGVVGMDIDFSVVSQLVASTQIYQTGNAFLVDDLANIMYHPSLELNTPLAEASEELKPLAGELKAGSSRTALYPYTWHGEHKKMVFRSLDNNMRLIVTAPTAEIDGEKNSLIFQIGIVLVLSVVISILLTVYMTRRMVRPLKELNFAAQKIAEGDLSISLTKETKDEVGTLAESFQKTVEHLQKYITYINSLAYRDSLTGVKNKTAYQDAETRLEGQMRLAKPEFAVIVLDINNLKRINDTYGHDYGDMIIISACKIICRSFAHSPVYRIGGDEFAVILEGSDFEERFNLMDKFQQELDGYNKTARPDSKISIARGIAIFDSETDLVFANVFKRADESMYQNKAVMKKFDAEKLAEAEKEQLNDTL